MMVKRLSGCGRKSSEITPTNWEMNVSQVTRLSLFFSKELLKHFKGFPSLAILFPGHLHVKVYICRPTVPISKKHTLFLPHAIHTNKPMHHKTSKFLFF